MGDRSRYPKSVAIIMDGNGRWAKREHLPRVLGHNAGMEAMKKIVIASSNLGVKYLTVYAFSTENWKRSAEEVSGIFKLIVKYVNSELQELIDNNVHINIMGQYDMLPKESVDKIDEMVDATRDDDGLVFNIALNYGGRDEIIRAVNEIMDERMRDRESGKPAGPVTEEELGAHLYSGSRRFDTADPDLIIRTSGEERISNFLIWQSAYSELMFTDTLWPDFTPEEYEQMLDAYTERKRRFGGREETAQ